MFPSPIKAALVLLMMDGSRRCWVFGGLNFWFRGRIIGFRNAESSAFLISNRLFASYRVVWDI
jgi:hypothetical protein